MIESAFADEPRVSVTSSTGLTVDLAREVGATCLLRSVRSAQDFDYEQAMAQANRELSGGSLETVLLYTLPHLAHVSSSLVRELISYHRAIDSYMPRNWNRRLMEC